VLLLPPLLLEALPVSLFAGAELCVLPLAQGPLFCASDILLLYLLRRVGWQLHLVT
jgi:hypothetical protein